MKKKAVTQLIQDIGKIRNMLEEKDYPKIANSLFLLANTLGAVKKNYDKYLKDQKHYLDFNSYDLEETSTEIKLVLRDIASKITIKKMNECALKSGELDFTKKYMTLFRVRSALTELQSGFMYISSCLRLFEEGKAKVKK